MILLRTVLEYFRIQMYYYCRKSQVLIFAHDEVNVHCSPAK